MAAQLMSFLANYKESGTARAIARLVTGNAAAHLVTLAALPIITRLYTPAEIGIISLFVAFVGFWGAIATLRIESALLIAPKEEVLQLRHMALWVSAFMASAGAITVDQAVRHELTGFDVLPFYAPLLTAPIIFLFGAMMTFRAISLRDSGFGVIANAALLRSIGNAVTRISTYMLGVFGLFLAEIVGYLAAAGLLGSRMKGKESTHNYDAVQFGVNWANLARKYRKYLLLETPSVIVNQAALLLPLPAVTAIYGPAAAGWFGLARMAVAIPNAQIGRAVADVYQQQAAEFFRNGEKRKLRAHFLKYAKKLAVFGLLPYSAIMLLAPPLVPIIFGSDWEPMGMLAAILTPWMYAAFVAGTLSRILIVMGKQQLKLIYDISALLLFGGVFGLAYMIELPLSVSIILFSLSGVLAYAIYIFLMIVFLKTEGYYAD